MYPTIRNLHLLFGLFALPGLLMYAISAVQMSHSSWFNLRPQTTAREVSLRAGYTDARTLAHEVMAANGIRGEINQIEQRPNGWRVRIIIPGTVHVVDYDAATGSTRIQTNVAGVMGFLNRLHHAAGLWHDYGPLNVWGIVVAIISLALVGLGATGIWMWWLRKQERTIGLVLLGANLVFSVVVLMMMRASGP
jgi:hypothetical protein